MLIRELDASAHNFTVLVAEVASGSFDLSLPLQGDADDVDSDGAGAELPPYEQPSGDDYDRIMADVWVGAVLTLLIFSCICCVCSCLLYHKFRQWKNRVQARSLTEAATAVGRGAASMTSGVEPAVGDVESLPSYTLVSGLPSYDEALDQLRHAHLQLSQQEQPAKLSAEELFAAYKVYQVS